MPTWQKKLRPKYEVQADLLTLSWAPQFTNTPLCSALKFNDTDKFHIIFRIAAEQLRKRTSTMSCHVCPSAGKSKTLTRRIFVEFICTVLIKPVETFQFPFKAHKITTLYTATWCINNISVIILLRQCSRWRTSWGRRKSWRLNTASRMIEVSPFPRYRS